MEIKREPTHVVTIHIAGDLAVIKQRCREYCHRVGLCVTVSPQDFIYTGGEESGVRVGLLNYPRFPSESAKLMATAEELARELMAAACQHSALIVADNETVWLNGRGDNPAAK